MCACSRKRRFGTTPRRISRDSPGDLTCEAYLEDTDDEIAADIPATSNGFSVGRWESDHTLVIETTHMLGGWLDGSGLPMSGDGARTVERINFSDDRLSADRTMIIHDPLYAEPLTRVRGWARGDDLDVFEQASCDPASYYVDLLESGLIEEYLKP